MPAELGEMSMETRPADESLSKFRLGIERSNDAVFMTDANGVITFANPAFEKIYGYAVDEALGNTPRILKSGLQSAEDYARFWERLLNHETVEGEILNRRKDGRLLHVHASNSPILDENGGLIGFLAIHRDISEQKRAQVEKSNAQARLEKEVRERTAELAEANEMLRRQIRERAQIEHALHKSEEQYRTLVEASHILIWSLDSEGRFSFVNQAARRIYGYDPEQMMGRRFASFSAHEQIEQDQLAVSHVLVGELVLRYETVHLRKDGEPVHLTMDAVPLRDALGNIVGVSGSAFDVTERKRAELALGQRNLVLETLNRLYEETASHLNLQQIFETTVTFSARLIDATTAYVSEVDVERGTSTIVAEYIGPGASEAERVSVQGRKFSLDETFGYSSDLIRDLAESFVIHTDDPNLNAAEVEHLRENGVRSVLGIPVAVSERPVAVIEFRESRRRRSFTAEEIELVRAIGNQMAIPIENAHLYAQALREIEERKQLERQITTSLERRSRQVRLSAEVSREIISATDLTDLYTRIVNQVQGLFGYYHVQLLRYDPALDMVALMAGSGKVGAQMVATGHYMPMGVGLIGTAAVTGEAVLRPKVEDDPDWQPNPLLPNTRGEVAVPIKLGDEVLGVLDVQSDLAGALDADDLLALEGLCGQLAIAIESTRLRQDMADRILELDKLQRIMSREGWQAFHAQRAADAKGYRFDRSSVKAVATSETDGVPGNGHGSELVATTMLVRGEMIGALGIEDDPANPLSPEEKELLESISVQVAEALESARLLEQTQRHAIEMEAVAQVSAVASTILDGVRLLETVTALTRDRFALHYVCVYLVEEDGSELFWAAGSSIPGQDQENLSFPELSLNMERSAVAEAARTGQPVVWNDVAQEPAYQVHPPLAEVRAELAIPLVVGDRVLGVLDLQASVANRFGEDDVRIHKTLGAQVAIAVQNANLYAEQLATSERLREVDRLKSEFLASMSHELRTPLNSIIGFADVLLEGIDGPLNDRMEEDVRLIRDSGRHLRELIGDILDMSKIEAGVMELRYEPVDIYTVAREIMATAKSLALDKDLDLSLSLDPGLKPIEADRTRLTQVLLNLVSNAIKFTEEGRVTLRVGERNSALLVAVEDTGIGISEADIPVIFEQFRQIDGSLTRKAGGTGLGMSISKSLVELHGGDMWVESTPGKGSIFQFTIPKERPRPKKKRTGSLDPTILMRRSPYTRAGQEDSNTESRGS